MKKVLCILTILLSNVAVFAQNPVQIEVDTHDVFIGEPIHLSAIMQVGESEYNYPTDSAGFLKQFILSKPILVDTLENQDTLTVRINYAFTKLDSCEITYVPGPFVIGGKSYTGSAQKLLVRQPQVNTDRNFRDVKDINRLPAIEETNWIWLYILLGLLIVGLAIFAYFRFFKNKKGIIAEKQSKIPANELAIQQINKLLKKQLWLEGKYKLHYTELYDILRTYFKQVLQITVFERTTGELIADIEKTGKMPRQVIDELKYMLQFADIVKYAKQSASEADINRHIGIARNTIGAISYILEKENTNE